MCNEDVLRAKSGDHEAVERIVAESENLIRWVALQYCASCGASVGMEDLMQEGRCAVMEAIRQYDPERGAAFSTYAVTVIKRYICSLAVYNSHSVRLPRQVYTVKKKIAEAAKDARQNGRALPTPQELSKSLDLPLRTIERVLRSSDEAISLDVPIGEDGDNCLGDIIPDDRLALLDDVAGRDSAHQFIDRMMQQFLTEQERLIIYLRYGFVQDTEYSPEEVSEKVGLPCKRVERIEERAIRKLSHQFHHNGIRSLRQYYLRFI